MQDVNLLLERVLNSRKNILSMYNLILIIETTGGKI